MAPELTSYELRKLDELARMILAGIDREEPHCWSRFAEPLGLGHVARYRDLSTVFYGCYDWHSAVHSHWSLARILNVAPEVPSAPAIIAALESRLTEEALTEEARLFDEHFPPEFECPYGLAWFVLLTAELWSLERPSWKLPPEERELLDGGRSMPRLRPLYEVVTRRIHDWLARDPLPDRTGQHGNTAFGVVLMIDAAQTLDDYDLRDQCLRYGAATFRPDIDDSWRREPGPWDFLSPTLCHFDILSRVADRGEYESLAYEFLDRFDELLASGFFEPSFASDPANGKLVHVDGLNLSKAWMLKRLRTNLPFHPQYKSLVDAEENLAAAGLASIDPEQYAGSHWLGTFAVYYLTDANLPSD